MTTTLRSVRSLILPRVPYTAAEQADTDIMANFYKNIVEALKTTSERVYDDLATSVTSGGAVVNLAVSGSVDSEIMMNAITAIAVELRLISELLHEGLNISGDLDVMRQDIADELEADEEV